LSNCPGSALEFVPKQTEEICYAAVECFGLALYFVKPNARSMSNAVAQDEFYCNMSMSEEICLFCSKSLW
jgi:hypothetical protein